MLPPTRGSPTLVQALPGPSVQVTAGSNHTAVLLMDGQVFTFGSFSVRTVSLLKRFKMFSSYSYDGSISNVYTCLDILGYALLSRVNTSTPCSFRKGSWAGPSWTCPTGMPSLLPCPTSGPNMGERPPGSVPAGTRRSCGSMRLLSTPMSSPLQRSSPANTSLASCPPLYLSRLHSNVC